MFPIDPFFVYFGIFVWAVIGLAVGMISGLTVSLLLTHRAQGVAKDALLGAFGAAAAVLLGIALRIALRWPAEISRYEFLAPILCAAALPVPYQFLRLRRLRKGKPGRARDQR